MHKRLTIYLLSLILLAPTVSLAASGATLGNMVAVLDIGQYIQLRNTGPIKVLPDETSGDPFKNFKGCRDIEVDCNFKAQLRVSAKAISEAQGKWSATITPGILEQGTTKVQICVAGANLLTQLLMGGQSDVPVAEVTIQVMAR
ncbi:MAG: hypothetical protein K9N55_20690 [Phycisphaerae bacterium]|nr:hypothetical protein [Phycisphaerae bacterium]